MRFMSVAGFGVVSAGCRCSADVVGWRVLARRRGTNFCTVVVLLLVYDSQCTTLNSYS